MSIFELWLLTVGWKITEAAAVFSIFGAILLCIGCLIGAVYVDTEYLGEKKTAAWGRYRHAVKRAAMCWLAVLALYAVAPNKQDTAIILGGYVVTNTEGVAELPQEIVDAARSLLDKVDDSAEGQE